MTQQEGPVSLDDLAFLRRLRRAGITILDVFRGRTWLWGARGDRVDPHGLTKVSSAVGSYDVGESCRSVYDRETAG